MWLIFMKLKHQPLDQCLILEPHVHLTTHTALPAYSPVLLFLYYKQLKQNDITHSKPFDLNFTECLFDFHIYM